MTPTKRKKPTKRKGPTKRTDRGGAARRETDLPENGSSPTASSAAAGFAKERLTGTPLNDSEESVPVLPGDEDAGRAQEGALEPDGDPVVDEPEEGVLVFPGGEDAALTQEGASELDDDPVVDELGGAAPDEADDASMPEPSLRRPSARKKASRRVRASFVLRVAAALVAAAVIVCFAVFAWDRWIRYDDSADLVGTWLAEDGEVPISITATEIELASDATLSYAVDPFSKTISYSLGSLEGSGRYRFSADRDRLAIVDGGDESWLATMSDDMAYAVQLLWARLTGGEEPSLALGESAIVLERISGAETYAADEESADDASETGEAASVGDAVDSSEDGMAVSDENAA